MTVMREPVILDGLVIRWVISLILLFLLRLLRAPRKESR